jgi:hypothetical protein
MGTGWRCYHLWVSMREDKINISDWIRFCARGALVFSLLVGYAHAQGASPIPAGKQPNIVLVLMDNLGWGEPGVYGGDYLLMMAEGFQESSRNQEAKSKVGAVGIMQLMPATGEQMKVGDITQTAANIHAGVKYIRCKVDKCFANEPLTDTNKLLFAFASYNAGPGRMHALRAEAAQKGFDPNVWFDNVEVIAASRIGVETVTYVANIYKYYVAYKLVALQQEERSKALQQLQSKPGN